MSHSLIFYENFGLANLLQNFMLFVTWRLRGSLRQKPHCATVAAVDRLLDRAPGEPLLLAQPRYARIVKRVLARYDGELYQLHAWVVMHNHIHLLIEPTAGISLIARTLMDETEDLMHLPLWVRESYERIVTVDVAETAHWIESHPVRAGLVARPEEFEWSSAHSEPTRKRVAA
jgi:putative transposase